MTTIKPAFSSNNIPIVFATDNGYALPLSVAICSIAENATSKYNYDVIVLESQLTNANKSMIESNAMGKPNVSVRFVNIAQQVSKYSFTIPSYYSSAIYYRLFMPYVMDCYDKILYLDCDVVVNCDVSQLFLQDIGDNYVGAVQDIGMVIYKYNTSNVQYLPSNYFTNQLAGVNVDEYFNSGVLVMNLNAFKKRFTLQQLIDATNRKDLLYPDQDGLNILCANNKTLLSQSFNLMPFSLGTRNKDCVDLYLPKSLKKQYYQARKHPKIIHYNMMEKPWLHPCWIDHDLMIYFWKYASKSACFEKLLFMPPTKFYAKTNRQRIPYFEKQEICNLFCNTSNVVARTNKDVCFGSGNLLFSSLSDLVVKYETIDFISSKQVKINASFLLGLNELQRVDKVLFVDEQENKFVCKLKNQGKPYCFGQKAIGQKVIATANVLLKNDVNALRMYVVFEGKNVQVTNFNFSVHFPIDRLNKRQYFYLENNVLTYQKGKLVLKRAGLLSRIKHEIRYDCSLIACKNKRSVIAGLLRIPIWILRKLKRKPTVLVSCNFLAEDNGFAFFKYLSTQKRKVNSYFVLPQKNKQLQNKLKPYGKILYKHTRKYQLVSLLSDACASSIADKGLIFPFGDVNLFRDVLAQRKFVFLQHGVISQDLSKEHNRFVYNPSIFVTSAQKERDSLKNNDYFYDNQVKVTGLPRFDYLYNQPQNVVTVMPTWRKYLNGDYGKKTRFYNFYYQLLHNAKLQRQLQKYGYRLQFKPHPLVGQNNDLSIYKRDENDACFSFDQNSYANTFAQSNLIVTDYSSAIFDFLYLKKPVIFAQFDKDEFFSGKHAYEKGYIDYEKNGFGPVTYDVQSTVDKIIEYVKNDCKLQQPYLGRVNKFFKYHDKNNCKRVLDQILQALNKL